MKNEQEQAVDRGNWIQTFSGQAVYPMAPLPQEINIRDIAHSLALICRFNGHCRTFYSVAQHSILVSLNAPHPRLALAALLHDAAEYMLGDSARPVKANTHFAHGWERYTFAEKEEHCLRTIFRALGVSWPNPSQWDLIRYLDDELLVTEARDLMTAPPMPWGIKVTPLPNPIHPLAWNIAELAFLDQFHRLQATVERLNEQEQDPNTEKGE